MMVSVFKLRSLKFWKRRMAHGITTRELVSLCFFLSLPLKISREDERESLSEFRCNKNKSKLNKSLSKNSNLPLSLSLFLSLYESLFLKNLPLKHTNQSIRTFSSGFPLQTSRHVILLDEWIKKGKEKIGKEKIGGFADLKLTENDPDPRHQVKLVKEREGRDFPGC